MQRGYMYLFGSPSICYKVISVLFQVQHFNFGSAVKTVSFRLKSDKNINQTAFIRNMFTFERLVVLGQ